MATQKMIAPAGFSGSLQTQFGTYTPDAFGFVTVDTSLVLTLLGQGFVIPESTTPNVGVDPSENALTAFAGGGQASATQLNVEASVHRVTTVATAGDSVKLPASQAGALHVIINNGANAMQLFGLGTDTINGVAAATGVSVMANSIVVLVCAVAGLWHCEGVGQGYSGSLPTGSFTNGITAFAGGGQGSAVLLTSQFNRVTTVATAGDSTKLPAAVPGVSIVVANAAATNSMNLFPNTGDAVNALGANAAYAIAAGKTAQLFCMNAGQWHAVLSA